MVSKNSNPEEITNTIEQNTMKCLLGCKVQMIKAKEERRNTHLLQIFYNNFYLSPE